MKTNLGHSEAASGISSVIKAVLAFEHKLIPATIGVQTLNPKRMASSLNLFPMLTLNSSPRRMEHADRDKTYRMAKQAAQSEHQFFWLWRR